MTIQDEVLVYIDQHGMKKKCFASMIDVSPQMLCTKKRMSKDGDYQTCYIMGYLKLSCELNSWNFGH